ncbi:hypothetical protein Pmani_025935 [Petrolisthes manimaculis]|uniref:Uncharacterized protein n=1 Tax=Petrolisthes manimaculis TaxID=1843537 RepID=A0AAE1P5Q3_9EUCA|nr:hypothetical protein Pmani_025935 [Petrolisthes manimaculis]
MEGEDRKGMGLGRTGREGGNSKESGKKVAGEIKEEVTLRRKEGGEKRRRQEETTEKEDRKEKARQQVYED